MALTKVDDRGLKTPIDLQDNEQIRLGTGNDLQIWHDSSNTNLKNDTGDLYIRSSGVRITNGGVTEHMAKFFENGAVELYYDNVKQVQTTADGFGFVNDPTNKELQLKSFTTSGNNFFITTSGSNTSRLDDCIVIKKDGSVKLFNDGNKRLETTGTGVDITDNLNVAGITTSTGVINSQTDIRINNVSVIETALNDAVAMAIALG